MQGKFFTPEPANPHTKQKRQKKGGLIFRGKCDFQISALNGIFQIIIDKIKLHIHFNLQPLNFDYPFVILFINFT